VLTKVTAHDPSGRLAPLVLPLTPEGRLPTDILQCSNIDGLEPVKANVNTSPYGSIDGVILTGTNVLDRNIVIDLLPKPDWADWNIPAIRNEAYKYFMPRSMVRLVFESTERAPVEISGVVESCEPNIFSRDNEIQVSIICPSPHFRSVTELIVSGDSGSSQIIDYDGTVPSGFILEVLRGAGSPNPTYVGILLDGDMIFRVDEPLVSTKSFSMDSIPGEKFVRNVTVADGTITSLLDQINPNFNTWPLFETGEQEFAVGTDGVGVNGWTLYYYNRYGGL
jgi:hypothetical protein